MPTIVRKSHPVLFETRRQVFHATSWRMGPNIWRPPTDVYEMEDNIVVKMEIAGMGDEDLEVTVQDRLLAISGFRSDSPERKAYHQMEIPFGKFSVAIELPVRVNADTATADYKDGFLTIQLPKE
jgi:HSP20 family protein